ncbi:MAG: histidinol-phosphate aminotransferase [marine bacterium B5-7]|nr:MAG: histidinol-phosphate aminotransferase [marine bacterium B5-7]
MKPFWSPLVETLDPYVPGEQPSSHGIIKLNTNENPYGPSPRALKAMAAAASNDLRLYPDPNSSDLKSAIADHYQLGVESVFVGNGSDEVLAHVFKALLDHDAPLLFADISYSFYPVYCGLFEIEYQKIPLSESFDIRIEDYDAKNGGIIIANPNAPTGKLLSLEKIRALLEKNTRSVVVVDEAYIDFGGESAAGLIPEFNNLLIVQTLSKSRALAGLRVGFALAAAGLIEALERVKNSFNSYPLSRLAQVGAAAAMRDNDHFDRSCQRVIDSRRLLTSAMTGMGFEVLSSSANFIFARHPAFDGQHLADALRQRAILVRHFNKPRIEDYLRISIGTDDECAALLSTLNEILATAG